MPREAASAKPLLDKLGVKSGMRVKLVGVDGGFEQLLRERGADIVAGKARDCDAILVRIDHRKDLSRIGALMPSLAKSGALWVLRPRGSADISESEAQRAGLDAGLVDVKVVRFSDTHTAEKFVYRLADR
jgi:hypothetical protein